MSVHRQSVPSPQFPGAGIGSMPAQSFPPRSLLTHGPLDLIDGFLTRAEAEARVRGVTPGFGDFPTLVATNEQNTTNWRSLVPVLDPRWGSLGENNFCLFGYDDRGEVVATQATRLYDFGASNLKVEAERGRLLQPHPRRQGMAGARRAESLAFELDTVAAAAHITGRAVYSGATWYRPDYRGRILSSIFPRMARAIAHTMWNTDYFFSFVETALVRQKMLDRYGYSNVEHGVKVFQDGRLAFEGALIWMHSDELLSDLACFVSSPGAQIDVIPRRRRA